MATSRHLPSEGEEVVVELRPHWIFLGWPLVAALAAASLAAGIVVAFPSAPTAVGGGLLVVLAVAVLWLAGRLLRRVTTSLVVTNLRIVKRSGVLSRRGFEVRLDRINELSYHQSLLGWALKFGELLVETGGERGLLVFDHVDRPAAVHRLISEQLGALRRSAPSARTEDLKGDVEITPPAGIAAVPRGPGGPSVTDRLVQLEDLRNRGMVTDAEFAAKRAELLGQL